MRLPDWQTRLNAFLAGLGGQGFVYGQFDCALFVAGAVAAMTGEDHAQIFRGKYDNAKSGLKLLAGHGHTSPIDFVAMHFEETVPALAMPGDIVVVVEAGERALGILQGEWVYVVAQMGGVALAPRSRVLRAFKVL